VELGAAGVAAAAPPHPAVATAIAQAPITSVVRMTLSILIDPSRPP
jgi:hypothetical protein